MKSRAAYIVTLLVVLAGVWYLLRGDDASQPPPVAETPRTEGPAEEEPLAVTAARARGVIERESATSDEASVPAPNEPVALAGLVVDEERAPVSAARVIVEEHLGDNLPIPSAEERRSIALSRETETGADGRFAFHVPYARALQLRVRAAGFGVETLRPAYPGHHYEIVLRRGAGIEGRVTEVMTGLPVSGVKLRGWRQEDRAPLLEGLSGEDGGFRFADLPTGVLVLDVTPPDHESPPWLEIPLRPGESVRTDIELEVGNTVVGTVTDARSGQPVAGAEVGAGWTFEKRVLTDAAGNYRMRGAPGPGVASMQARAIGYAKGVVPIEGETRERIDFALQPAGSLRGRVIDRAGVPLSRTYVAASGRLPGQGPVRFSDWQSAWTDDTGIFRLTELVPGVSYTLFLRKAGYTGKAFELSAPIDSDRETDVGDLPLDEPGALSGRVVDQHGSALAGVFLTLTGSNADRGMLLRDAERARAAARSGRRDAHTDSGGAFAFVDLPEGTYGLVARVQGGPRGQLQGLDVVAGETTIAEMTVDLGWTIAGRVVTSDGSPLPFRNVVIRIERDDELVRFLSVDHEGRFRATGLEQDEYDLSLDVTRLVNDRVAPWLGEEDTSVAAGTEDVELVLQAAETVEGRVVDAQGRPRPGLSILALVTDTTTEVGRDRTDSQGRFRLRALPGHVLDLRYGVAPESEYPTLVNPPVADTSKLYRGVRAGTKGLVLEY